ncbi:30S ribosomal protein S27ae [Candidatus Woesearchaeota archaeon]|nr:MAG: 30S ribosomal protein S27ae [Candidatus Woesearchaeota archaeon]
MAAKKSGGKKEKKERSKKPAYKLATLFEIENGHVKRKNKTCPKCGQGFFLAAHKDRLTCGKCGYMEKKS